MFYIEAVDSKGDSVLVKDTADGVGEWYHKKDLIAIIKSNNLQIFGVKFDKTSKSVSFNALGDPRYYLFSELKRHFKFYECEPSVTYNSSTISASKDFAIRDLGEWIIPEDAYLEAEEMGYILDEEDDYDWRVLSDKTRKELEEILTNIYKSTGYKFKYSMEEKNWLYFVDRR